jgi:nucleoid DNA-binding protein
MQTLITREQIIKELSERCRYFQRDIRAVLTELDDLVEEHVKTVDEDNEEVAVQVVRGLKLIGKYVPERDRRDPRTNTPITCSSTVKLHGKVSETIKETVQKAYEDKKSEKAE